MLTGVIINKEASLNNFKEIGSVSFIPGEQILVNFRVYDQDNDIRYVLPATADVVLTFNLVDGESLSKTASIIDSQDLSMWSVELSEIETQNLLGGNSQFEIDVLGDGSVVKKGIINNGLQRVVTGC